MPSHWWINYACQYIHAELLSNLPSTMWECMFWKKSLPVLSRISQNTQNLTNASIENLLFLQFNIDFYYLCSKDMSQFRAMYLYFLFLIMLSKPYLSNLNSEIHCKEINRVGFMAVQQNDICALMFGLSSHLLQTIPVKLNTGCLSI